MRGDQASGAGTGRAHFLLRGLVRPEHLLLDGRREHAADDLVVVVVGVGVVVVWRG